MPHLTLTEDLKPQLSPDSVTSYDIQLYILQGINDLWGEGDIRRRAAGS